MIPRGTRRAVTLRMVLYFALWIIVDQSAKPSNLFVGLLASAAATWVSVTLLPPKNGRIHLGRLMLLLPRFLWQSIIAGVDVGRRAFSLPVNLQPGFIDYQTQLPPGAARNAFELIASLMPGTVPSDEHEKGIEFHCIDNRQPVAAQLRTEELLYAKALLPGERLG